MPHGYADYGGRSPKKIVHALYDLGELGERISGVRSIDRLGDVYFFDEFANGLGQWLEDGSGLGYSTGISGSVYMSKGWSCKLVSAQHDYYYIFVYTLQPYLIASKMGIEIYFSFDSNVYSVNLAARYYTGTGFYYISAYINIVTGILYLYTNPATSTPLITGLTFTKEVKHFYNLKLVFDLETGYYVRLYFNGELYDISSYFRPFTASTEAKRINLYYYINGKEGLHGISYLDSVLLTQNEP